MNNLEREFLMRTCRTQQYNICGEWMKSELFPSSIAFHQSKISRRGRNECANTDVH